MVVNAQKMGAQKAIADQVEVPVWTEATGKPHTGPPIMDRQPACPEVPQDKQEQP